MLSQQRQSSQHCGNSGDRGGGGGGFPLGGGNIFDLLRFAFTSTYSFYVPGYRHGEPFSEIVNVYRNLSLLSLLGGFGGGPGDLGGGNSDGGGVKLTPSYVLPPMQSRVPSWIYPLLRLRCGFGRGAFSIG
jgi:hypothetical protein